MPIQIDSTKKGAVAKFIKEKVQEGATIYLPSSIFTIYALNELKEVIQKSTHPAIQNAYSSKSQFNYLFSSASAIFIARTFNGRPNRVMKPVASW